ncbi:uncharacterized protein LOC133038102 [Cannabis sativa]|uniref:uncharacterized protein LOC133038102 n=1 Tax=Cannabis sativa TaxID=3483 RepID=UPI0029CA20BE|nr:uncharacterized protein LOC133038102 [Cannabis sativa]
MGTKLKFSTTFHPQTNVQSRYLGLDAVERTSEAIEKIIAHMLATQSRHKSYADPKHRDIEFQVGDFIFLRVSPMKGIWRFGKKVKLSPRFIGPFEILERKYVSNTTHILSYEDIELQPDLSYEEQPVQILYGKEKILQNKTILLVKVLWRNKVEEATWELDS